MSYNQYRPQPINFLPAAIKNLFIVNGLFFLATMVFNSSFNIDLTKVLGLHYWTSPNFHFYQILTHVFMHDGFTHILFNMFALWMFGAALENRWGSKRFLFFYFFTALGSVALYQTVVGIEFYTLQNAIDTFKSTVSIESLQDIITKVSGSMEPTYLEYLKSIYADGVINAEEQQNVIKISQSFYNETLAVRSAVGASGAVFGVLTAFALYNPNTEIFFLFIPFPIKAKYFVAGYAIMELYLGIQNNPADNVAHFAHLGGALFGFILVKYWNKNNRKSFY
jgi:membrane associated rhomboid family serine protease